jgi:hypothetical protein
LTTPDLKIIELGPDAPRDANGRVWGMGLPQFLKGDIHIRFTITDKLLVDTIIHEATHKFASTYDKDYLFNNCDMSLALRQNPHLAGALSPCHQRKCIGER